MAIFRASPETGAAWITGASEGIGRALAIELATEGYTVFASARSTEKLHALAQGHSGMGKIIPLPLDVTDREANRLAVEKITQAGHKLALAIFNAGNFFPVRGHRLEYEPFDKSLEINVTGVVNGLVPAVEAMKAQGFGHLALVASSAGYGGLPKSAAYGASKAGLINLAASLKFDLDPANIRVQVVTPGFVETPLTGKNDFPMPFLMPVDKAAKAFANGLRHGGFDISFPRRFTFMLKALNLLPYSLYFPIVARMTGAKRA
jgi:NAD(P)-dependent dehydrogenase (short-subunit alcohol dehydrogenase family)